MSRTFKDMPNYLKDIQRNEEELNRHYLKVKKPRGYRYQDDYDYCLDCSFRKKSLGIPCTDCKNDYIEDLVTMYENSNAE